MRCSVIDYNEVRMSALFVHEIFPSLVFLYWAEKVRQHRELTESSLQGIYFPVVPLWKAVVSSFLSHQQKQQGA